MCIMFLLQTIYYPGRTDAIVRLWCLFTIICESAVCLRKKTDNALALYVYIHLCSHSELCYQIQIPSIQGNVQLIPLSLHFYIIWTTFFLKTSFFSFRRAYGLSGWCHIFREKVNNKRYWSIFNYCILQKWHSWHNQDKSGPIALLNHLFLHT